MPITRLHESFVYRVEFPSALFFFVHLPKKTWTGSWGITRIRLPGISQKVIAVDGWGSSSESDDSGPSRTRTDECLQDGWGGLGRMYHREREVSFVFFYLPTKLRIHFIRRSTESIISETSGGALISRDVDLVEDDCGAPRPFG